MIEKDEIKEVIEREKRAWDTQNIKLLLSIFHPDFVWVWPKSNKSHGPIDWVMKLGKFDTEGWSKFFNEFFIENKLIHSKRVIKKIEISKEEDAAFAVVDIDTLWTNQGGEENHWNGRVCKIFSRVDGIWKIVGHTGILDYSLISKT